MTDAANLPLDCTTLQSAYRRGALSPLTVADEVLRRIEARDDDHVWVSRADPEAVRAQARRLAERRGEMARLPLYGLPFGVKDNVDVEGLPTTCGCEGYGRLPQHSAAAVQRAIDAGALFIGKQTLDQFATGLNGTRTTGGHCLNVFDPAVIPGGSSSGSGVAVAAGLVSFSLGSDTGGSGRVPAAMNNIVGVRPTIGLVSSRGMVYNNRLFDCMPVFAHTVDDAFMVLEAIAGFDAHDPLSRADADGIALDAPEPARFRFAVPRRLEFFGDMQSPACFEAALLRLERIGGERCEIDFSLFHEAGALVFESALVAERSASYGEVLERLPHALVPAVESILRRARGYSAVDAFQAQYRLQALRQQAKRLLTGIDVVVTPTVARPFRVDEMLAEPIVRNAEVGHYTYGVGPLDLCALALPAAMRPDGLPFGISLVGRAGHDGALRALGRRFEAATGLVPGVGASAAHLRRQEAHHLRE
ncbi:allophanate hydrolase [Piscinibacter gummiphilus]|uniref:Allophanate hydrolase n=1 Tax=Piscinibacter gummiphilus TaxID=946333 RepID=A0ABZ0CQJ2_9BURK|nr:allophanate hydrolase [Piscinibacter gummiphilus]WOB07103.1 allophanate hydrolase [Piscinibacter gummiphilus]